MLIVFETITWKPHIETGVEIALRHRDSGDQVVYCSLRNSLPACEDDSAIHRLLDLPETRTRRAGNLLRREGIEFIRPGFSRGERRHAAAEARRLIAGCSSIDDLKRLEYGDYRDIGWGVLSSVISVTRDSTLRIQSHQKMFRRYLEASILVFEKAVQVITERKPSEVLLFNGRFATTRAVLRAAQSKNVPWKIHERGGSKNRYTLSDFFLHDTDAVQAVIARYRPDDRDELGHKFFQGRRNREEKAWHSFAESQITGQLPAAMNEPGDWVTFFTSSDDEMVAIGDEFVSDRYPVQMDAIHALRTAVAAVDGLRLCIRVHPHIAQKSAADKRKWMQLDLPGVLVLGPEDPTDSYALMERSKVVCTYGSTVGIEATYWGRPSLLFCGSYYDKLGVCAMAGDVDDIVGFLRDPITFPRERTLAYGAYWEELGTPYRYYQADGLHRGRICGVYLDDSLPMKFARPVQALATRLRARLRRSP